MGRFTVEALANPLLQILGGLPASSRQGFTYNRQRSLPMGSGVINRHIGNWQPGRVPPVQPVGALRRGNNRCAKNLMYMPNPVTPRLKDFPAMAHRCQEESVLKHRRKRRRGE